MINLVVRLLCRPLTLADFLAFLAGAIFTHYYL